MSQKLLLYIADVFIHSFLKFSKRMLLSFGRQDLIVSSYNTQSFIQLSILSLVSFV